MSISKLCPNVRRLLTAFAVAMTPLFTGGWSWNWNWLQGPQSTLEPEGPVAAAQDQVFYVTVWVVTILFIIVGSVLAYATLKFKARGAAEEHAEPPEQGHGNPLIELSLIGASVLALVIIAVPTVRAIWYDYDVPAAEKVNAYEITATGYQWWFRFEYPGESINAGGKLLTANEMVIPVGRPVKVNLRTVDVIHSFWVPKLAGKVDMIPNRGNHLWLQADHAGYFWGQCAEFCGEDHAVMRFRVIALDPKEFQAWVAHQKEPGRTVNAVAGATEKPRAEFASYSTTPVIRNSPGYTAAFDADPFGGWKKNLEPDQGEDPVLIAKGRQLFQQKTCVGCHTVRGQEGAGNVAPDLTHVGARSTIAGGLLENNPANLYRWVTNPDNVKPGNKMYVGTGGMAGYMKLEEKDGKKTDNWVPNITINDSEARALVAYLRSLK